MFKRATGLMIAILVLCLAGCGSAQSACMQFVSDFTDSESVKFVETIDQTNQDLKDQYLGDYVFEDDTFQYIVDRKCFISAVSI